MNHCEFDQSSKGQKWGKKNQKGQREHSEYASIKIIFQIIKCSAQLTQNPKEGVYASSIMYNFWGYY